MIQIWKNIKYFIFSSCLCASANADCEDPFIQHWHNSSEYILTIKGGTPWHGQALAPSIGTAIGPGIENDWVLFNELSVDISTSQGTHMGEAELSYSNGVILETHWQPDGPQINVTYKAFLFLISALGIMEEMLFLKQDTIISFT